MDVGNDQIRTSLDREFFCIYGEFKDYISYQKIFINKYSNSQVFEKTKGNEVLFFALSIIYQVTIINSDYIAQFVK